MMTSAQEFVSLRMSEHREEYLRAATDEAPMEVWLEVIRLYPEMRKWVAHNKTVPLEVLDVLIEDEDEETREWVAMKRKLSHSQMRRLAVDQSGSVRASLAGNASLSEELLDALTRDTEEWVAQVAQERKEYRRGRKGR